jgi:hypothetical protein
MGLLGDLEGLTVSTGNTKHSVMVYQKISGNSTKAFLNRGSFSTRVIRWNGLTADTSM